MDAGRLLIVLVVTSLTAWRVAWFIQRDSLIDATRDRASHWLRAEPSLTRMKIHELLTCPFCLTIWTAALSVGLWPVVTGDPWWGWAFIYVWLAVAALAVLWWRMIAGDD